MFMPGNVAEMVGSGVLITHLTEPTAAIEVPWQVVEVGRAICAQQFYSNGDPVPRTLREGEVVGVHDGVVHIDDVLSDGSAIAVTPVESHIPSATFPYPTVPARYAFFLLT